MKKIFLAITCLLLCLSLSSCTILVKSFSKTQVAYDLDICNYETVISQVGEAKDYMPSLNGIGEHESKSYSYQSTLTAPLLGFYSDGIALFVKYSTLRYLLTKPKVESNHKFITEPIRSSNGGQADYLMPITQIEYKGYVFRVVKPKNENQNICKSFLMIGFDDSNYKIAYLYFCDADLDYIGTYEDNPKEVMTKFLDTYFYWNDVE